MMHSQQNVLKKKKKENGLHVSVILMTIIRSVRAKEIAMQQRFSLNIMRSHYVLHCSVWWLLYHKIVRNIKIYKQCEIFKIWYGMVSLYVCLDVMYHCQNHVELFSSSAACILVKISFVISNPGELIWLCFSHTFIHRGTLYRHTCMCAHVCVWVHVPIHTYN